VSGGGIVKPFSLSSLTQLAAYYFALTVVSLINCVSDTSNTTLPNKSIIRRL